MTHQPPNASREQRGLEFLKAPGFLVAVGSSTLTVAVLYYFGFVYTRRLYELIGVDVSALELGTPDYVIRSLNTIAGRALPWVLAVLIGVLVAVGWLLNRADHRVGERSELKVSAKRRWAMVIVAALGVLGIASRLFILEAQNGAYLWLTGLAILTGVTYAVRPSVIVKDDSISRFLVMAGAVLMALAFVYGVFEVVRYHARAVAEATIVENETDCFEFPFVTIFSAVDLHLEESGARMQLLETAEEAMSYRYENLRRFLHDNGRLIVWPADRPLREGVIVLLETDSMRIDTHPQVASNEAQLHAACPKLS